MQNETDAYKKSKGDIILHFMHKQQTSLLSFAETVAVSCFRDLILELRGFDTSCQQPVDSGQYFRPKKINFSVASASFNTHLTQNIIEISSVLQCEA